MKMHKLMMNKLSIIFIVFCSMLPVKAQDTNYVTPSDLEPNTGIWVLRGIDGVAYPITNSVIESFRISPDGRYLAYLGYPFSYEGITGPIFHIYDIKNNLEIYQTNKTRPDNSFWFEDSTNIIYISRPLPDSNGYSPYKLVRLNLETLNTDSISCSNGENNCYFNLIGPDKKGYIIKTGNDTYKRFLLDSSFISGLPINEPIPNYNKYYLPLFPPCDINYTLSYTLIEDTIQISYISGFSIIKNFDYENNRSDFLFSSIPLPDTSWKALEPSEYTLGPYGEIYFSYGYISKSELKMKLPNANNPDPFDSTMLAARQTWGYYRIDTTGKNLVQLVRYWGPDRAIGRFSGSFLQTTCDGTIYYSKINMDDTTAAIWKMNRYGKNKEMVFNLKKPISSVFDNPGLSVQNKYIDIQSTINSDEINIIIKEAKPDRMKFEIYGLYGNKLKEFESQPGEKIISFNKSDFASGLYFLIFRTSQYCGSIKFPIIR